MSALFRRGVLARSLPHRLTVVVDSREPSQLLSLATLTLVADTTQRDLRRLASVARAPLGRRRGTVRSLSRRALFDSALARMSYIVRRRGSPKVVLAVLLRSIESGATSISRLPAFRVLCDSAATALRRSGHPAADLCRVLPSLPTHPRWQDWRATYRRATLGVNKVVRRRIALIVATLWIRAVPIVPVAEGDSGLRRLTLAATAAGHAPTKRAVGQTQRQLKAATRLHELVRLHCTQISRACKRSDWAGASTLTMRIATVLLSSGQVSARVASTFFWCARAVSGDSPMLSFANRRARYHLRGFHRTDLMGPALPKDRSIFMRAMELRDRVSGLLDRNLFGKALSLVHQVGREADTSAVQMRLIAQASSQRASIMALLDPQSEKRLPRFARSPSELRIACSIAESDPLVGAPDLALRTLGAPVGPPGRLQGFHRWLVDLVTRSGWQISAAETDARYLARVRRSEHSWLRMLVLGIAQARAEFLVADRTRCVRTLAELFPAWRGYRRWLRSIGQPLDPELLRQYERECARALASLDPPRKPGKSAVETLVRVANEFRPYRRTRTDRAIAALDAIVTIGHSAVAHGLAERTVQVIASMLRSRVLFLRHGARWIRLRRQTEHTLSGWTLRRLAKVRKLRAFRVRARPEFWRPEQRRPGALLVFPIAGGLACIARRQAFRRRDLDAARVALRFLDARLAAASAGPAVPSPRLPAVPATAQAEGVRAGLVGASAAWRHVLDQVHRAAPTAATVLLVGATGTGKEQVARTIHAMSPRSTREFVAVNCAALPPTLLMSELFGHVRGAFTGADRTKEGLFVKAHRGTLFLDELADMPTEMQGALLRVLEERRVRPVGAVHPIPVDVRLVAAAGHDLRDDIALGRFREDLYHRLDVVRIDLPSLRQRREDIPSLAAHLVGRLREGSTLHPDAIPVLLEHPWPGNVRELENVLRAAAVLADGAEITPETVRVVIAQHLRIRSGADAAPPHRDDAILAALRDGWSSATELASRVGCSSRTVNRVLAPLVERGLVVAVGAARARRYARPSG